MKIGFFLVALSLHTSAEETSFVPDAGVPAASTESLETIVQSAPSVDSRRVAGSAHVFTQEDMERHEHDDVNNLLRGTPGVYLRTEDGFGLRPNIGMRGASSDRSSKITLMEDGVLFAPAPYSAPAAYYFPMITRMEGAELYKGAASVRYGPNTIGGAFNLISRKVPVGWDSALDVAYGSFQGTKLHGYSGYGGERVGFLIEALRLTNDGFKQLDNGGPTGFARNEVNGKFRLKETFGAHTHTLELKGTYSDETSHETYLGISDSDFQNNPLRRYAASQKDLMSWNRWAGQLSHDWTAGRFRLQTSFYRQNLRRTWNKVNGFRDGPDLFNLLGRPGTGQDAVWMGILRGTEDSTGLEQSLVLGRNLRSYLSQGVQSVATYSSKLGALDQRLEVGARFHHDEVQRHHSDNSYAMRQGTLVSDGVPDQDSMRNGAYTRAMSFYFQEELSWNGWLFVPGLRAEIIRNGAKDSLANTRSTGSSVAWLPGAGLVRQVGPHVTLLAGVHQGFSPVSPGQAPEVQPEKSWNYEAGARLRSRAVKAELIGFFNDYFNITGECSFSAGCPDNLVNRQYNGGKAHVYGLEAASTLSLPRVWKTQFEIQSTYTLTLSRFLSSFDSAAPLLGKVKEGDSVPFIPTHLFSTDVRFSREGWTGSIVFNYVGDMRERAGQGTIPKNVLAQAHTLVDVALHRNFTPNTEMYLTVNNLLNARYVASHVPFGARPGAPLNGFLGLKHKF